MVKEIVLGEDIGFQNQHNCKKVKKENITPSICFRNQLSQIPGISTKISEMFVEKYKTIVNMIKKLEEDGENDREKIIENLSQHKFGANNKKIGEKTAEKIYHYFFDEE